jgi:hypothetical protein
MCVDVSLEGETRSGLISLLKGWCTNVQQTAQKVSGAVQNKDERAFCALSQMNFSYEGGNSVEELLM